MNTNRHYCHEVFAANMPQSLAWRAIYFFQSFKYVCEISLDHCCTEERKKMLFMLLSNWWPCFYHCIHMNIAEGSNASSSHSPINSKVKYPTTANMHVRKQVLTIVQSPLSRSDERKNVHFVIQAPHLYGKLSGTVSHQNIQHGEKNLYLF